MSSQVGIQVYFPSSSFKSRFHPLFYIISRRLPGRHVVKLKFYSRLIGTQGESKDYRSMSLHESCNFDNYSNELTRSHQRHECASSWNSDTRDSEGGKRIIHSSFQQRLVTTKVEKQIFHRFYADETWSDMWLKQAWSGILKGMWRIEMGKGVNWRVRFHESISCTESLTVARHGSMVSVGHATVLKAANRKERQKKNISFRKKSPTFGV